MIQAICQREQPEPTTFIAQCSLKSRQHVGAVQWSSPKAGSGGGRGEQSAEEATRFPLERGSNDCAVDWKYSAT